MALAPAPNDLGPDPGQAPRKPGISRRQALAAAVAAGAGVGAVRLLGGALSNLQRPPAAAAAAGTDWISPLSSESARVMQLLRRATFGATAAQLEAALSEGFGRTVDRLIETPPAEPPALEAASTPGGRFPPQQLQEWWIAHALGTPTPFAERMNLFWHGHFTSDYRKVADNTFVYWQNLTWRRMAMTNLRSMLMQVTVDPAMLRYLDLATSVASSPNENYSRELMELFTMGPGNYTEEDVRQGALALSGWVLPLPDATGYIPSSPRALPVYSSQKTGRFVRRRAYTGDVRFLGRTGPLDTQGVIDRILEQPATAPFIAAKVVQQFVSPRPASSFVDRIANAFRKSGYDMKTLMRAVLTSAEFAGAGSYRSLVKSPIELMLHAARALEDRSLVRLIATSGSGMGQTLFDPPDVGGWPANEAWISSNTVIERVNFVTAALAQTKAALPSTASAVQHQLDGVVGPQTAKLLTQAGDERARWFVILASPEFQLK